jgi:hypothetical protein
MKIQTVKFYQGVRVGSAMEASLHVHEDGKENVREVKLEEKPNGIYAVVANKHHILIPYNNVAYIEYFTPSEPAKAPASKVTK